MQILSSLGLLLSFVLIPSLVSATPTKTTKLGSKQKLALYACRNTISSYLFDYTPKTAPGIYYDTVCNYPPAAGSLLLCCGEYSKPYSRLFNKTIAAAASACYEYGGTNKSTHPVDYFFSQYENATQHVIDPSGYNITTTNFTSPIHINKEENEAYYRYLADVYYQWDMPSLFASIFYYYFILVFVLHGVMNFFKRLGYRGSITNNSLVRWYKGHISTPSVFNGSHTNVSRCLWFITTLLPTRLESIVVIGFIILNVILSSVNYHVDLYEGQNKLDMITQLIADRAGLLSFGLIPLLALFAGRNNLLIQLTGVPYATFIVYHKWVARFMFVHAMIHGACWTAYAVRNGYLKSYYAATYWIWGVVALVVAGLTIIQAFHCFRTMSYEVFLVVHIVFASLFLVGCFYHCYDLGYLEWIYASWALWITDRLVRVYRLFMFGSKVAQIELLEGNMFKMSVDVGKFDAFPGSYAFIYFMTPYGFWQSHPFTMLPSAAHPGKLVFMITAKKGMTRYLKRKLSKSSDGKLDIRVGIEGPYGHRAPLEKYSEVLLLAGGTGIPGLLSHALDLSSRESIDKQNVNLIWVVRSMEDFRNYEDEMGVLAARGRVRLDVYMTSGFPLSATKTTDCTEKNANDEQDTSSSTDESNGDKVSVLLSEKSLEAPSLPGVSFHEGRPVFANIVNSALAQEKANSLAIMTCGPPRMCDDIRSLASRTLLETDKVVDLFEELQVW